MQFDFLLARLAFIGKARDIYFAGGIAKFIPWSVIFLPALTSERGFNCLRAHVFGIGSFRHPGEPLDRDKAVAVRA